MNEHNLSADQKYYRGRQGPSVIGQQSVDFVSSPGVNMPHRGPDPNDRRADKYYESGPRQLLTAGAPQRNQPHRGEPDQQYDPSRAGKPLDFDRQGTQTVPVRHPQSVHQLGLVVDTVPLDPSTPLMAVFNAVAAALHKGHAVNVMNRAQAIVGKRLRGIINQAVNERQLTPAQAACVEIVHAGGQQVLASTADVTEFLVPDDEPAMSLDPLAALSNEPEPFHAPAGDPVADSALEEAIKAASAPQPEPVEEDEPDDFAPPEVTAESPEPTEPEPPAEDDDSLDEPDEPEEPVTTKEAHRRADEQGQGSSTHKVKPTE